MPASLRAREVVDAIRAAARPARADVVAPDFTAPRRIVKPFPSPADWRDRWIYFLMIDRFNHPSQRPRHDWDRATDERQGGTFEGVRQQLPYLEELGAGAIWLTPVLRNRESEQSHHGYGIMDFLEVDPRFGSTRSTAETELIRLVDEAHARGMYVILDVVINHAGDLFAYDVNGAAWNDAPWSDGQYPVFWRDETGTPRRDWTQLPAPGALSRDAGVWPEELQRNEWFRRRGKGGGDLHGDFETLKEFQTELIDTYGDRPVWSRLIDAYQYVIARFDVDGFRIDTLKHVERDFALTFCNAIREFALAIGKKNFFLFGENKSSDEGVLAAYTGRFTADEEGRVGADAALDFPLQWTLGPAVKGFAPPSAVQDMFDQRKRVHQERNLLSTHGEASRFFVTFLDNHDDPSRFLYPRDGGDYSSQLTLALACLFFLQGIPCLYYGTEQGLAGTRELYAPAFDPGKGKPEHVREALWGKPNAFDRAHAVYAEVRRIAELRAREPALRYGRQYFRQVSGNDLDFGFSRDLGGVLAFSRILNDREIVVVANTSADRAFSGWVLVDSRLHGDDASFAVAYSNHGTAGAARPRSGPVRFWDREGPPSDGWARRVYVRLGRMEVQVLAPEGGG